MNYGWDDGHNTWYTLDALHYPSGGSIDDEYMLENIYPAPALGSSISGTYGRPSFPWRYFDRDATGSSATFEAGQELQFLPDIVVICTSTTGGSINFYGSSLLFTRGDGERGIQIHNGVIKLHRNGGLTFP